MTDHGPTEDVPDTPAIVMTAAGDDQANVLASVVDALKDVVDPELGVNIVDLGLIYGLDVDQDNHATIEMTLTTPMCPLTDQLEYDVRYVLDGVVDDVTITWVWLPPWTMERITDDGREQLRAIGYHV